MSYVQIVSPNLSAVGRIGWCLEYQARVWGTTHVEPTAWAAWGKVQQHTDTPPTDVAFPLWFSFYTGGVNEGHVVTYVPGQGYYSSPWKQGTTHAVLPSIAEIERIYGAKYVGWSEDILKVQVIRKEDTMNEHDVKSAYSLVLHRDPESEAAWQHWVGKSFSEFADATAPSAEWKGQDALIKSGSSAQYVPYNGPQLFTKK